MKRNFVGSETRKGSTSTSGPEAQIRTALGDLPNDLREALLEQYAGLKRAYREGQFDVAGLRAGKFCEVMLRVLQHQLGVAAIPLTDRITNFTDNARQLEKLPAGSGPESLRVILPRAIEFLYTLRNKRAIGHVGGDVDANAVDAAEIAVGADWVLAELIRVVHSLPLKAAQQLVDALAQRDLPAVWRVGVIKRVLPKLKYPDQVLLLLHSEIGPLTFKQLLEWTEHSNVTLFRRDVVRRLHKARLVEFDASSETVTISPLGARRVESVLLPRLAKEPAS